MSTLILSDNGYTCIGIKNGKMYALMSNTPETSYISFTVDAGLHIELGREVEDYKNALKHTRLPIIFKEVFKSKDKSMVDIIRIPTGKLRESRVLVSLACKQGVIYSIAVNRRLIKDEEYKRLCRLPIMHQLCIPYNLNNESNRKMQCDSIFRMLNRFQVIENIVENKNKLEITVKTIDGKKRVMYIFLANDSMSQYEFKQIMSCS